MLAVGLLHVHASPANLHMQIGSPHSLQGFHHANCAALPNGKGEKDTWKPMLSIKCMSLLGGRLG